jgi:hypothetical protein
VSIDISEVYTLSALRAYLLYLFPSGVEIVKGMQNRVPEPASQAYIVITPLLRTRLDTTVDTYQDNVTTGYIYSQVATELTIQCDFHGGSTTAATVGDMAQIFTSIFRSDAACTFFDQVLIGGVNFPAQPLYTSDPRIIPFTNDEDQEEYRYVVDACIQINPTITQTQQFAAALQAGIIQVDATYHP